MLDTETAKKTKRRKGEVHSPAANSEFHFSNWPSNFDETDGLTLFSALMKSTEKNS